VTSSFGNLAESYGETIDLTLYRCIQEAITNAIRHGKATHLTVDLAEQLPARKGGKRSSAKLCLSLAMTAKA
jgi:two-component system sensor histidine kinase UhpB